MTRREFLARAGAGAAALAFGGATYAYAVEREWVEVTRRTVTLKGWPAAFDGLCVAHLTDLHHSPIVPIEYLASCVAVVNAERPDLVALTGDYITKGEDEDFIQPVAAAVGKLRASLGVFATLGNHDVWVDAPAVHEALARRGCLVLRNRGIELVRRGGRLAVVGLGDLWTEDVDFRSGFRGIPEGCPSLVLMHNPDSFEDWPAGRPGLILSGHTHGGQVAIPGYGPPLVPSRYGRKYARGFFEKPEASMYVNRGLGTGLLALRFLSRPEIAFFTIRSA